ncbi:hypothetical protein D917_10271 [Trichinella nativa]|uniref:Secreted protein n=1 Tax=Trichinella nativa TaxID=6335 RepID=A0A1Y3ECI7_9BILA|nr:hypothetical protein D917_10271 [Trichinella nativa]
MIFMFKLAIQFQLLLLLYQQISIARITGKQHLIAQRHSIVLKIVVQVDVTSFDKSAVVVAG